MRVRRDQAELYYRLLDDERYRMTIERGRWKRLVPTLSFNAALALLDASKEELLRAAEDGGWDIHGEPGEPNTSAASAPSTTGSTGHVGQRPGASD